MRLADWIAKAGGPEVRVSLKSPSLLPGILFENRDRPVEAEVGGWRVLSGFWSTKDRISSVLGGDPHRLLSQAAGDPREPPVVEPPWREEIRDPDLTELPIPKFFKGDGGRYLTSAIFIARSHDGHVNASYHRMMLLGGNRAAIRVVEGRHFHRILREHMEAGEELRVAIAVGGSPPFMLASASSPGWGVKELAIANTLSILSSGSPEEVAEVSSLPVPVSSPVVMEGILNGEEVEEGPFLDLTWTYDRVRKQPVVEVERILISERVLYLILPGGPEHKLLMGLPRESLIWGALRSAGMDVKDVVLTEGGCGWLHCVISIRKKSEGEGRRALEIAFRTHRSLKHAVVVDDDIDPRDPVQVEWAIATRLQFDRDSMVFRERGSSLDPSSGPDHETCKVGLDATAPLGRRGFELSFNKENLEKGSQE